MQTMGPTRSEGIRKPRKVGNINDWLLQIKEEWKEYINHMSDDRIVEITNAKSLIGAEVKEDLINDGVKTSR